MMNGKEEVTKEEEHEGTLQTDETRGAFKFKLNYCLFSKWQEEASVPHLSPWSYEVFYCSHRLRLRVRHILLFVSQCRVFFHPIKVASQGSLIYDAQGDRTGTDGYWH